MPDAITIEKKKIKSLLNDIEKRRFAVPKLQREFVWDGPKAAKLLDSIVRGLPIGVVMIWQAPRSQRLHLRQNYSILPPFNGKHPKVWFLLDGQQRVSVLYHVRTGTPQMNATGREVNFSRVVLALDHDGVDQLIRYRKPVEESFVSLSAILNPWWRQRLAYLGVRKLRRIASVRDQIRNYRVPLMFVRGRIEDVRETFRRVNTQGMKITTADAIFSRAEDLELRDVLHEVRDGLDDGFQNIEAAPILFAMLAARGGEEARGQALERALTKLERDVRDDPRLKKRLQATWTSLRNSFHKAIDYLRVNFQILNRGFLYTDYIIAILALFYFRNGGRHPDKFQKEQIRRWFWATSVGGRYSGRNFNRYIRQDVRFFRKLAEGKRRRFTYSPEIDRNDMRRAQYASRTGITSAVYSLLLLRRPVSIMDDGLNEIPLATYAALANRKDRHHIFPAAACSRAEIAPRDFNSIVNVCLLTAEENQGIGVRHPRMYLRDARNAIGTFRRKMARHLIPAQDGVGVWTRDFRTAFRRFVRERTELLCNAMEEEAGIRLFRREERRRVTRSRR